MNHSLAEHGVTWSEDGTPDGFQVGKSAALLDWQHEKERQEFKKLCQRLYSRNWARKFRERYPEKAREQCQRWREANRDRNREIERNRMRAQREKSRSLCVCEECGKSWKPAPRYTGRKAPTERKARFCSKKCRNRWHDVRRARARNRGLRRMDLTPSILRALRAEPWLTPGDVHERIGGSLSSVRVILSNMGKAGELQRKRRGRAYAYAVKA